MLLWIEIFIQPTARQWISKDTQQLLTKTFNYCQPIAFDDWMYEWPWHDYNHNVFNNNIILAA